MAFTFTRTNLLLFVKKDGSIVQKLIPMNGSINRLTNDSLMFVIIRREICCSNVSRSLQ